MARRRATNRTASPSTFTISPARSIVSGTRAKTCRNYGLLIKPINSLRRQGSPSFTRFAACLRRVSRSSASRRRTRCDSRAPRAGATGRGGPARRARGRFRRSMAQSNQRLAVDLDEIERQLRQSQAPGEAPRPDPLAELARIVGQDDPFRGASPGDRSRVGAGGRAPGTLVARAAPQPRYSHDPSDLPEDLFPEARAPGAYPAPAYAQPD